MANIIIAGAGGIGKAVALILAEYNEDNYSIQIGDRYDSATHEAVSFVKNGCTREIDIKGFVIPELGSSDKLNDVLKAGDILLDCLPGSQAPRMAQFALENDLHYANLTEYVEETNEIARISAESDKGFVLQTGLAPGFINVLAMKLYNNFRKDFSVTKVDKIKMKVGALSMHSLAPYFYAFTWSPIGVSTEYVKDAIVLRDFEKTSIPSLSETKGIIIDGDHYEENFTSGGAADLPDAFNGKVRELDYKTLRYPGHYSWVKNVLENVPAGIPRIEYLENTMLNLIPAVEDDEVLIFATVIGRDRKGMLRAKEKSYKIYPSVIGNQRLRAIQTTTAAPLCEICRMLLSGKWKGTIYQSQIEPDEFLSGPYVKKVYEGA